MERGLGTMALLGRQALNYSREGFRQTGSLVLVRLMGTSTVLNGVAQRTLKPAAAPARQSLTRAQLAFFSSGSLTPPHGGKLVDRMVKDEKEKADQVRSCEGLTLELSERQVCDVELIVTGAFSPLEGFMNEDRW